MTQPLMQQFNLEGRTALVTGGATGMGFQFARILAEAGAQVLIASRNEERLKQAAEELETLTGGTFHYESVDLGERDQAVELVNKAHETMGRLDIFVGNAGAEAMEPIAHFSDETYDSLMAVNLTSNVFMTRAALPLMKKQGWGRIIFTTSIATQTAFRNPPVGIYAATKGGLEAFARFAAIESATDDITVNCIAPGGIKTKMSEDAVEEMGEEGQKFLDYQAMMTGMNRWGDPEELAGTLLLLASDAGSYITGCVYTVDGGYLPLGDSVIDNR